MVLNCTNLRDDFGCLGCCIVEDTAADSDLARKEGSAEKFDERTSDSWYPDFGTGNFATISSCSTSLFDKVKGRWKLLDQCLNFIDCDY